jgi:hypothetical protein
MIVISPSPVDDVCVERLSPKGEGKGNVADLDPAWHLGRMTNPGSDRAAVDETPEERSPSET